MKRLKNYTIEEVVGVREDFSVKIIIVGDNGVGKSNIINRFVNNEFGSDSRTTVGVELSTKAFQIDDNIIKLHLWDTVGQERFKSLTKSYYKGSKGVLLVYDITNYNSFENVEVWISQIREYADHNHKIVLIGNKSDLSSQRQVETEKALTLCKENLIDFYETSALTSYNINQAFKHLLKEIYESSIKEYDNLETEMTSGDAIKIEAEGSVVSNRKCC